MESEKLLRAERQIITSVWLPGTCTFCDGESKTIRFNNDGQYRTFCEDHSGDAGNTGFLGVSPEFTLADLRNALGFEVKFYNKPGWV